MVTAQWVMMCMLLPRVCAASCFVDTHTLRLGEDIVVRHSQNSTFVCRGSSCLSLTVFVSPANAAVFSVRCAVPPCMTRNLFVFQASDGSHVQTGCHSSVFLVVDV
jgi:hypothetical protein